MKEYYIKTKDNKTITYEAESDDELLRNIILHNIEADMIFSADDNKYLDLSIIENNESKIFNTGDIILTNTGDPMYDGLPFVIVYKGIYNALIMSVAVVFDHKDSPDYSLKLGEAEFNGFMMSAIVAPYNKIKYVARSIDETLIRDLRSQIPEFFNNGIDEIKKLDNK